jgi:hypothetical protein
MREKCTAERGDQRARGTSRPIRGYILLMQDAEVIAQELSALGHKLDDLEKRMAAVEKVNTRLEEAALTKPRPARLGRFQVIGTRSMRRCAARISPKRPPSTDSSRDEPGAVRRA